MQVGTGYNQFVNIHQYNVAEPYIQTKTKMGLQDDHAGGGVWGHDPSAILKKNKALNSTLWYNLELS